MFSCNSLGAGKQKPIANCLFLPLQPDLDQPADGFGATDSCALLSNPTVDFRKLFGVHANNLRLTWPSSLGPAYLRL